VLPVRYFVDDDLLDRVPHLFMLLSAIFIGMQIAGVLLLKEPSEDELR